MYKKFKILHVLPSRSYSGAENVAIQIIKGLSDKYEAAYCSQPGPIIDTCKMYNVQFIPIKSRTPYEIARASCEWGADLVHAHGCRMAGMSVTAGLKIPVIFHLHNDPDWIRKINPLSLIHFYVSMRSRKVISCTSTITEQDVFNKYLLDKVITINNVVDSDKIKELSRMGKCNKSYDVALFGRLNYQKDPLRFLSIIKETKKYLPNIKVVMIGDGDLKQDCELYIEKNELKDNVDMCGFMVNPFYILKNTKVVVSVSKFEGLPMALLEAMSLNKPVIATPVGGNKIIVNNSRGVLCDTDKEFIHKIIEILTNERYYDTLSEGVKDYVDKNLSIRSYLDKVNNVYMQCFNDTN
ncbi:hypothetical protein CPJCM30710_14190 [Clostridium polyendosporum]|uniref:Uncharacterized protein n=1 Tax=Clostridium polyendosporum TaxID=69208 RepID=A0A919S005_9CLOT|nr:glycosyltransferase [Clostridium polyendosporum]GIM28753.1 hypothetical protein CPJCM30710_14190 [Clostridium polyendosporum]